MITYLVYSTDLQLMESMTPTESALNLSLSSPRSVDVKFWVFSKRIRVTHPESGLPRTTICAPREVFGISSILKSIDYFDKREHRCGSLQLQPIFF